MRCPRRSTTRTPRPPDVPHDVVVKVFLTAEEFLAFRAVCDEHGLSQSSMARQLIKRTIADFVLSSGDALGDATAEKGRD